MTSQALQMIDAVIKSVKETSADKLTRGLLLTNTGCVCSIGAYLYNVMPEFRARADELRAAPSQEARVAIYGSAPISALMSAGYEFFEGQFKFGSYDQLLSQSLRDTESKILCANDIMSRRRPFHEKGVREGYFLDETLEQRKDAILNALNAERDRIYRDEEIAALEETIKAVEATDPKIITRRDVVDQEGCLCSIGVFAYNADPDFKTAVDEIRAGQVEYSKVQRDLQLRGYHILKARLNRAPHAEVPLVSEIFRANDEKSLRGRYEETDPAERKKHILEALVDLLAYKKEARARA